jgi:hypothetical protein
MVLRLVMARLMSCRIKPELLLITMIMPDLNLEQREEGLKLGSNRLVGMRSVWGLTGINFGSRSSRFGVFVFLFHR